ncbi:MAG: hypothetical protein JJU42_11555 [Rhodobacteraceae bacterium]|nr:hypothetical protein [Paracoccaceae bacterium]
MPVPLTLHRAALPCVLLPLLALPLAAEPRVEAVTLSTAGTALIEAALPLEQGRAALDLRRADIDAFLKSVVVGDPAGSVIHLRLPGPAAFDDAFAALPLAPEDLRGMATLLDAMAGASVTVDRRGVETQGVVMGVSNRPCEHGPCPVLTLRDDAGALRAFDLDDSLSLRFDDTADAAIIDSALAALRLGRDPQALTATFHSDDPEGREVSLQWLQSAPVWKTAWRAVDTGGGLALTGWAVIENTTGQDWDAVQLTLATGAVQTLRADLYDRRDAPAFDQFDRVGILQSAPSPAARMAPEAAEAAVAETVVDDGESFSRFTLTEPVTLAAGEVISLPFLRETLGDARRLVFRGGSGARHPMIALDLENPLPLRLPAGVLTFYDGARGHAGDAQVPELAPGARAVLDFARDTGISLREDVAQTETLTELRIADGMARLTEDRVRRTTYRIEGAADGDRRLTLEHPRRGTWTITTPGGDDLLDTTRFMIDVPAGETVTFEVTERQPRRREVALARVDSAQLALWMRDAPDAETRALLADLTALRRNLAEAQREARRLRTETEALIAEQARLVDLIVALDDDTAASRDRRARVDALDARITEATDAARASESHAADLERRIAGLIGG